MVIIVRKASTFFGRITLSDTGGNGLLLTDDDKLIFSVKRSLDDADENVIICKVLTAGNEFEGGYVFELTPEETDIPTGKYFYDIGVQRADGEFYHAAMTDEFIIKQSISRKDDDN